MATYAEIPFVGEMQACWNLVATKPLSRLTALVFLKGYMLKVMTFCVQEAGHSHGGLWGSLFETNNVTLAAQDTLHVNTFWCEGLCTCACAVS